MEHSNETRIKFQLDYDKGALEILSQNPEYLDVLNEEFSGQSEKVVAELDMINQKYQDLSQTQYDLIYQKRAEELLSEIRNGQHTNLNDREIDALLNKRINAEHEGVIEDLTKRMLAEKIAKTKPLQEAYDKREEELIKEILKEKPLEHSASDFFYAVGLPEFYNHYNSMKENVKKSKPKSRIEPFRITSEMIDEMTDNHSLGMIQERDSETLRM
mgnify:CR=1 FL=1